jgi:flagellar biosynthesis/type III secretory pathway M-ring protein FliF/YscJ
MSADLVTVYETTSALEVGMVKSALDEAEIPYAVLNDLVSSVIPTDGMLVIGFQVDAEDADAARELLASLGLTERQSDTDQH